AAAHPGGEARERVRPVLAYLEGHCRDAVGLADAASVAHISPSRLRHLFKDVTGLGFKEYVTHIRLAEAKRLLLTTDLSVAEVAAAISYTNLHQFYRVFQRSCAMSPAEYRRYYTTTGATGTTGPTGATGILWATSAGTTGPQATPARPPRRERP
ncbi:MAG TPA: helix-turn-helix domain-containing protein, partial [Candidatus Limnocylindrales bacterium]